MSRSSALSGSRRIPREPDRAIQSVPTDLINVPLRLSRHTMPTREVRAVCFHSVLNAPTPLSRKLAVISETAKILTDIINTKRSLRLEVIIVVLIAFEIIIMAYQIMMR
jgi:hypothetical protein